MIDYTNKKINFENSKIQAKITKRIAMSNQNQIYQCINAVNLNQYYCLKIITCSNEDKVSNSLMTNHLRKMRRISTVKAIRSNGIVL